MYGANLQTIPAGVDGYAALAALRQRVNGADGPTAGAAEEKISYLRSEHTLVRFLIARQWDVEKATTMLRDHYRWLAETKMETLLLDPFPEEPHIKAFYPQCFHGTDKTGRPIYIERPGLIDMRKLLQYISVERLLMYFYASTERQQRRRFPACSLARGEVVDKSLNIMDLSNLGFSLVTHTTARKVLRDVVQMLQNHYPEASGQMIIINAPKVFSIAWSFVKPMLDEKTVSKIAIYGSDREAYSQVLLKLVDADQLPSLFGGSCKCDGKTAESCMQHSKGPWMDPEVLEVLDAHTIERIMTPEGSRLLFEKRAKAKVCPPCSTEAQNNVTANAAATRAELGGNSSDITEVATTATTKPSSPTHAKQEEVASISKQGASTSPAKVPLTQAKSKELAPKITETDATTKQPDAHNISKEITSNNGEAQADVATNVQPASNGKKDPLDLPTEDKASLGNFAATQAPQPEHKLADTPPEDVSSVDVAEQTSKPVDKQADKPQDVENADATLRASQASQVVDTQVDMPEDVVNADVALQASEVSQVVDTQPDVPKDVTAEQVGLPETDTKHADPATEVPCPARIPDAPEDAASEASDTDAPATPEKATHVEHEPNATEDQSEPLRLGILEERRTSFMSVASEPASPLSPKKQPTIVKQYTGTLETLEEAAMGARGSDASESAKSLTPLSSVNAADDTTRNQAENKPVLPDLPPKELDSSEAADTVVEYSLSPQPLLGPKTGTPAFEAFEDLRDAELEVSCLLEECSQHEDMHMQSLIAWIEESNTLVRDIGRDVIERSQTYYDCESLWKQSAAEHAEIRHKLERLECELEKARSNLSLAESALEAFLLGESDLMEEEWNRLAPLPIANELLEMAASDPKLLRSLRVSAMSDSVVAFINQREEVMAARNEKGLEVEEAKKRFDEAQAKHWGCSWNCSVKRAEPFHRKRQAHEDLVSSQVSMIEATERRLQKALRRVAALQAAAVASHANVTSGPGTSTPSTEKSRRRKLTTKDFEIAGAEPREDEYFDCEDSDGSA